MLTLALLPAADALAVAAACICCKIGAAGYMSRLNQVASLLLAADAARNLPRYLRSQECVSIYRLMAREFKLGDDVLGMLRNVVNCTTWAAFIDSPAAGGFIAGRLGGMVHVWRK